MAMKVCAIVLAAGSGSRFGGLKQFEDLGGRPVLDWSLEVAAASCDAVVLVGPPGLLAERGAVAGGATRSESVRAGLAAVPPGTEIVVIHDSARPLADAALYERVVAAVVAGADAAIPAVPVTDTIKRVEGTLVAATIDRSTLVAVQTPQAFRVNVLRDAHARGGEATDDAALVELIGGKVVTVEGDRRNLKLTTRDDLVVARALVCDGTRP
jgi:2-C-methyl-D-erythritol 4-phosphate cytidylyltransferase